MLFFVKHKPQFSAYNENLHEITRKYVKITKEDVNYIFPNNAHISISWFSLKLISHSFSVSLANASSLTDWVKQPQVQS